MNCAGCGSENPDRAHFCMDCGHRFTSETEALSVPGAAFPASDSFVGRQRELGELQEALE